MGEQDRLRVFDQFFHQFFRNSEVKVSAIPGLGLGLTIANAIVREHRGTITVESTLGEGTSFMVRIPSSTLHSAGETARNGS